MADIDTPPATAGQSTKDANKEEENDDATVAARCEKDGSSTVAADLKRHTR